MFSMEKRGNKVHEENAIIYPPTLIAPGFTRDDQWMLAGMGAVQDQQEGRCLARKSWVL